MKLNLSKLYNEDLRISGDFILEFGQKAYKPNPDFDNDWLSYAFTAFEALKHGLPSAACRPARARSPSRALPTR